MRRTLLTLAAFALCATGVGCATSDLMPNPPSTAGHADTALDTAERAPEPVARPAMPTPPATPAPAPTVTMPEPPAPVAGRPSGPSPSVTEAPAPVTVNPSPAPVAPPAVDEPVAEGPVLDEPTVLVGPCFREDVECYGDTGDYAAQSGDETTGREYEVAP